MKRTTSKKSEEQQDAAATPKKAETPLEALYRRVKRAQQRRAQKRKHINP